MSYVRFFRGNNFNHFCHKVQYKTYKVFNYLNNNISCNINILKFDWIN